MIFTSQTALNIALSKNVAHKSFKHFLVFQSVAVTDCADDKCHIVSSTFLGLIHYLCIPIAMLFHECDLTWN